MRRRVLFVVTYFDCGGINRALQSLLNCMDADRYDIDVFGMVPDGMFASLYKNCRVLPRFLLLSALMARYSQQKGIMRVLCFFVKVLNRFTKGRFGIRVKLNSANRLMKQEYDTVVAFSEGAPTAFVRLMRHPNSVAWIHCDYSNYLQLNSFSDEKDLYSYFKNIVCVAECPRDSFLSCYPEMASRTRTIYNILDEQMIKRMALLEVKEPFPKDTFNIVSIGRLDPVKHLSVVPILAKQIIKAGCKIMWYVIGPKGGTRDEFEKLINSISEQCVNGQVHYLGERINPYAYISRSDLLVNTSISEACPYVINEAIILHTPVVCTNFESAKEFIANGENGFICSIQEMSNVIVRYIQDDELKNRIKMHVSTSKYDNEALLKKVYQVLG